MLHVLKNPNSLKKDCSREQLGKKAKDNMGSDKPGKPKRTGRGLKFCPKCGSTDVFWAQGMPQFWSLWQCRNCGYYGALILEDGNLAVKLQEEWKNKTAH